MIKFITIIAFLFFFNFLNVTISGDTWVLNAHAFNLDRAVLLLRGRDFLNHLLDGLIVLFDEFDHLLSHHTQCQRLTELLESAAAEMRTTGAVYEYFQ